MARRTPDLQPRPARGWVASARRVDLTDRDQAAPRRGGQEWQGRAWDYYDLLSEIKYGARFCGQSLSKLRMFPAVRLAADQEPVPVDTETDDGPAVDPALAEVAADALTRIETEPGSHASLWRRFGVNAFVAGECWLAGWTDPDSMTGERWGVYSVDELRPDGDQWRLHGVPGANNGTLLPDDAAVYRIWQQHPRWGDLADSSVRGVLDLCDELLILSRSIRGAGLSRLNAGVWMLPDTMLPEDDDPTLGRLDGEAQRNPLIDDIIRHLTTPVSDPASAAAVVPYILTADPDDIDVARQSFIEFGRPFDTVAADQRAELIRRIANGVDLPAEVLLGLADVNHWCQDETTEILARGRGWIRHDDLAVGDVVLTLNHDTGAAEWQSVLDIYRADVVDEPMHAMRSRSHSSLSTGHHRWPIVKPGNGARAASRQWTTSQDGFTTSDRVPVAAPLHGDQTSAKYADDFVRLVVAFTSDGSYAAHGNVQIAKFADREIVELRRILTDLYGPGGFREHPHPTSTVNGVKFVLRQAEAAALLDLCDETKAIPVSFVDDLTDAQRLLFLDSCPQIGDGVRTGNATTLYQVEPSRLEAFGYAAHLTGHKVTVGVRNQQTGFGTRPLSWVRWSHARRDFAPASCKHTIEPYTGVVWCPTTANHTWFARRDGRAYFTGNTAWLIDEQTFTAHLEGYAVEFCSAVSDVYLRPYLLAAGFEPAEVRRVMAWYDASELVANADQGKTADEAHDRLTISDEWYRKLKNLPEESAPDEAEYARRAALRRPRSQDTAGRGGQATVTPGPPGAEVASAVPFANTTAGRARLDGLGLVLADLDRALMARLLVAADASMARALERAGARLRSKAAKGNGAYRDITVNVDNVHVAFQLGPQLVAQLGVDDDDLLEGAFDDLAPKWERWVKRVQEQALGEVTRFVAVTPEVQAALAAQQEEDRNAGWLFLAAALAALAKTRLYRPEPDVDVNGGEFDDLLVPAGLIRQASTIAGGGEGAAQAGGALIDAAGDVVGQVATGPRTTQLLATSRIRTAGYVWLYGDPAARRHNFPPHLALADVRFDSFDDPVLAVVPPYGWLKTPHFFPGDHKGCFPAGTVVSGPEGHSATLRQYEGEMVRLRFASGEELTATPNHPVLTDEGWVAAGLLDEGCHVVRCLDGDGVAGLIPHDQQMPARIEKVAGAIFESAAVVTGGVPVAAEEFHGDGGGSDVAVVGTHRLLQRDLGDASVLEPLGEQPFLGGGGGQGALPAEGGLYPFLHRTLAASHSGVRRGGHLPTTFGGPSGGGEALGFAGGAGFDPEGDEATADGAAADPGREGDGQDGLASFVSLDKVVDVDRYAFSGHVFNLSTDTGWYYANGVIVHNCLCTFAPMLREDTTQPVTRAGDGSGRITERIEGQQLPAGYVGDYRGPVFHSTTPANADAIVRNGPASGSMTSTEEFFVSTDAGQAFYGESVVAIPDVSLRLGDGARVADVGAEYRTAARKAFRGEERQMRKAGAPDSEIDAVEAERMAEARAAASQQLAAEGIDGYVQGGNTIVVTNLSALPRFAVYEPVGP